MGFFVVISHCYQHLRLEVLVLVEIKMKWLTWSFFSLRFFWFLDFLWILTFSCTCRWRSLHLSSKQWAGAEKSDRTGNWFGFLLGEKKPLLHRSWSELRVSAASVMSCTFSLLLGICTHHWGISRALPGSAWCSASCLKARFFQRDLVFIKCWE